MCALFLLTGITDYIRAARRKRAGTARKRKAPATPELDSQLMVSFSYLFRTWPAGYMRSGQVRFHCMSFVIVNLSGKCHAQLLIPNYLISVVNVM